MIRKYKKKLRSETRFVEIAMCILCQKHVFLQIEVRNMFAKDGSGIKSMFRIMINFHY